jgi:hypothetical protein
MARLRARLQAAPPGSGEYHAALEEMAQAQEDGDSLAPLQSRRPNAGVAANAVVGRGAVTQSLAPYAGMTGVGTMTSGGNDRRLLGFVGGGLENAFVDARARGNTANALPLFWGAGAGIPFGAGPIRTNIPRWNLVGGGAPSGRSSMGYDAISPAPPAATQPTQPAQPGLRMQLQPPQVSQAAGFPMFQPGLATAAAMARLNTPRAPVGFNRATV